MSESPEVERSIQNPKGRSNLEQGAGPQVDKTDPTEPVEAAGTRESPQGSEMKSARKTDKVGTA